MSHPQTPYLAAWQLWRHRAGRRLRRTDPPLIRSARIPIRARSSGLTSPAVLTTPAAPRGFVVVPGGADLGRASDIARALHRVGLGTLEMLEEADAGMEARAERLIEAARWLARAREAERMLPTGLLGLRADAAASLAAAASGVVPIAAVVAAAGRYDGLDEARLAGLRSPVRLIAARDDATGHWQARQVVGWLAAGKGHDVVAVPGAADFTPAGWRHARWLAGAWLVDHLDVRDAAEVARSRSTRRLRLARGGLSLMPLAAFVASAWLAQPGGPQGARAAPARLWAGGDWVGRAGGLPVQRMDAALPGTIELAGLSGPNGFRSNGISASDYSGYSVSGAGDVNGDGMNDILIGAPDADPHGDSSGQSYVVYGGPSVPGTVALSALNGANGFVVNGISASDQAGFAVSGAGDVNRDNFDDILIGAHYADPHGENSGQSYVVYGGAAVPGTVELSALDGTSGFIVNGIAANDESGFAVSGAGDVNRDSFDDILIGAPGADPNGAESGQSYVVYGSAASPGTVELSALDGTSGFIVHGAAASDSSGNAVSGAGDVNGDTFDDILIGAPGADPNGVDSGQSYVVYGGAAVPQSINLADIDGENGLMVNGIAANNNSGYSVSGAGDVNGDGRSDILIGAWGANPHGVESGQSYLVYGTPTVLGKVVELSELDGTSGFTVNGISASDQAGFSVSGAGDVNGDSFDDILIGAHYADPHGESSGQSYVVYGGSGGPATIELSALDGWRGFVVNGISEGDESGFAVSGAGDVNGDGFGDMLIGARFASPDGSFAGQSYVVYGNGALPTTRTPTPTPTSTEPSSSPTATSPTATPTPTESTPPPPTEASPTASTPTPPSPSPTVPSPTATPTATPSPTGTTTPRPKIYLPVLRKHVR